MIRGRVLLLAMAGLITTLVLVFSVIPALFKLSSLALISRYRLAD